MISSAAQYAVRAMILLAMQSEGKYLSVRSIGDRLHISPTFLSKILRSLVEQGMVESHRGPGGGLRIASGAAKTTVKDIVVAVDGEGVFTECVLGLPGCGDREPCPVHDAWGPVRAGLETALQGQTIADLAGSVSALDRRLA
jgi:Rrf2 family protein